MNKLTTYIFYIFVLVISTLVAVDAYNSFYPFKILKVNSATTTTDRIKAGETLFYTVDFCKFIDTQATVSRTIHAIDESLIIPFPIIQTVTPVGCYKTKVPLQISEVTTIGRYYVLINSTFELSSKRNINVLFRTNEFDVYK